MPDAIATSPCVLVCQNRSCKKQGAIAVLQSLQALNLRGWQVVASPCMGQCGSGPMVRVLPEDVWYWRVRPEEVATIAQRHLIGGHPVREMLYPVVHS
ncbi:MAG: (2Fe-2S) ferredoxin domain-containing protein [Leptolyngbyaceae cyanobacterium bins.302]|nr:(2Fe-2S) ferredoxin domain-containing protein [Leptolyngbyaceae cyanobacterium bins.302]